MAAEGPGMGIVNTGTRQTPPDAPYFALELEPIGPGGLVFAAAVCSEGDREEDLEVRRYAMTLLHEFFRKKGNALQVSDYRLVLRNAFRHIHRHIRDRWGEKDLRLDLLLVLASPDRLYAARCGGDALFLYREDQATEVLPYRASDDALLGSPGGERVEVQEVPVQPGDVAVLCGPSMARVMGARDITVILRRAGEPRKAAVFLSAIAERKGAEGVLTAVVWQVPNYRGAAMLVEEPAAGEHVAGPLAGIVEAAEPMVEGGAKEERGPEEKAAPEEERAEKAKRQWLSKWRRHREKTEGQEG